MSRQVRQPDIDPLVEAQRGRFQQLFGPGPGLPPQPWLPGSSAQFPPQPPPPIGHGFSPIPTGPNNGSATRSLPTTATVSPGPFQAALGLPMAQQNNSGPMQAHLYIPRLVRQRSRRGNTLTHMPPGTPMEVLSNFYRDSSNRFELSDRSADAESGATRASLDDAEPSTSDRSAGTSPEQFPSNHTLDHWSGSFKCPVCLEYLKQPVILPCGHTFCKTCVWRLIYHRAEEFRNVHPSNLFFFCPSCRRRVQARNFARYAPVNIAVASAIEGFMNSEERWGNKKSDSDSASCETQTSRTFIDPDPAPCENKSTQTDLDCDTQHLAQGSEDTGLTIGTVYNDVASFISRGGETSRKSPTSGQFVMQGPRSGSAPPVSAWTWPSSRQPQPGSRLFCSRTESQTSATRDSKPDEDLCNWFKALVINFVFIISSLVILDGYLSNSDRQDSSPLNVVAWAALLATSPAVLASTISVGFSFLKRVARQFLWWRKGDDKNNQ